MLRLQLKNICKGITICQQALIVFQCDESHKKNNFLTSYMAIKIKVVLWVKNTNNGKRQLIRVANI